jgi:hypothetical protein
VSFEGTKNDEERSGTIYSANNGINIMWKFGRITKQRLNRKIKCSLKNFKMIMNSSKVE